MRDTSRHGWPGRAFHKQLYSLGFWRDDGLVFAWTRRMVVLLLLCVACGAGEAEQEAAPPQTDQTSEQSDESDPSEAPRPQEPPADEELDEPLVEPSVDIDDMDERALEAACFAGQQAACDQLGH